MVVVVAAANAAGIYRAAIGPIAGIAVTNSVANPGEAAAVTERRIAGNNIRTDQRLSISFAGAIAACRHLYCRVCVGPGTCVEDSTATVGDDHADRNCCGSRGTAGLASVRSLDGIIRARDVRQSKSLRRPVGAGTAICGCVPD